MNRLAAPQQRILNWVHAFAIAGCISLAAALMSFGQVVLMPLALAMVFSFLLHPVVSYLERRGLRRAPSVIAVVGTVAAMLAFAGWQMALQLQDLVHELQASDRYVDNLQAKVEDLRRVGSGGVWNDLQAVLDRFAGGVAAGPTQQDQDSKVVVQGDGSSPWSSALSSVGPLLAPLGSAALVVVLLIFILLDRENLRNRMIGLFGHKHLAMTTHAIDDAGRRIGRYLLMQFVVNASYGLCMTVVLYVVGLPFSVLWGFLAAILRYVPYIGPWLAASLPLATSLIAFAGWQQPLLLLCFVVALELFSNMVMEPLLYGQSVGLSPVALIVSTSLWTLLWGPIGLVLATPLTVCLVVLGQHVSQLRPLAVLLGDTPALPPAIQFYQRLLAHDRQEAFQLAVNTLDETRQLCRVFDSMLIPALLCVRRDRERGEIEAEDATYAYDATRDLTRELAAHGSSSPPQGRTGLIEPTPNKARLPVSAAVHGSSELAVSETLCRRSGPAAGPASSAAGGLRVLACPAHHEVEELVNAQLAYVLETASIVVETASTRALASALVEMIAEREFDAVFIAVMPPGGLSQAAYLVKEFRKAYPDLQIIVGCWGWKSRFDEILAKLRERGANYVTTSLCQTQSQVVALSARLTEPVAN